MSAAPDVPRPASSLLPSWGLALAAAAALAAELAALPNYGWFRDELYYVACSRHLDWGYVDHPPGVALAVWLARHVLGEPLVCLRLAAALLGVLVILATGRLAGALGGGRYAQGLAALCVAVAPRHLGTFHELGIGVCEILIWVLAALVVARLLAGGDPRLWLLFGLLAGMGLEVKDSMLLCGLGIFAGVVLTSARGALRAPWIWAGGAVAALLLLPNLLWQAAHGWPTLEFLRNAQTFKNLRVGPLAFFAQQILPEQPLALPIWLAGLLWLAVARRARPYRALAWTCAVVIGVLAADRAKSYYLGPLFPLLFAAGAVAVEDACDRWDRRGRWDSGGRQDMRSRWRSWGRRCARPAIVVLLLAAGAVTAPLKLPLLSVDALIRYQARLGLSATTYERKQLAQLPQDYADMFGWPELAAAVARAYRALPDPLREHACVFAQNYGEAGAVARLRAGLPPTVPVLSGHNSYYLWGPGTCDGTALILIAGDPAPNRALCATQTPLGAAHAAYAMPYEQDLPLTLCRTRQPLSVVWPVLKHYD